MRIHEPTLLAAVLVAVLMAAGPTAEASVKGRYRPGEPPSTASLMLVMSGLLLLAAALRNGS